MSNAVINPTIWTGGYGAPGVIETTGVPTTLATGPGRRTENT
jgi:hypothetical protein